MPPTIKYHCGCMSLPTGVPPPPHLPSSSYAFHALHSLYFCEECDAVRCNRCVAVEVSGYYCPNCLFEVPSASVRAEKNRCARNCFECPVCTNTLMVVPSDPPEPADGSRAPVTISTVGEPPFFLYCNHCRWDSFDAGVTFEKPTGLALQLQKTEDSAPEILEVEKLKEHFEPALRHAQTQGQYQAASSTHQSLNPIHAAASSALSRELPSFKSTSSRRPGVSATTRRGPPPPTPGVGHPDIDDPNHIYKPRIPTSVGSGIAHDAEVEWLAKLGLQGDDPTEPAVAAFPTSEIASLSQRLHVTQYSWAPSHSLRTVDLKPTRVPLRSKKSKRCPKCTHILIKPELKAQSIKWKIKLVAANYLPSIEILTPTLGQIAIPKKTGKEKESSADDAALASMMLPGRTYPFHLVFSNPLYDPITVRLSVQRSFPAPSTPSVPNTTPLDPAAATPTASRRPPYAISLPTSGFSVAAYAEAWEYEDEEDEEMLDDDDLGIGIGSRTPGRSSSSKDAKSKVKTVGVLERRANVTKVGGEVVVGKDGKGAVKFNMLVSYTYRSDDPTDESKADASIVTTPSKGSTPMRKEPSTGATGGENMKTFSFYTVVDLGSIAPKELLAKAEKQERRESVQTVGVYN
ncbi:hypothetical protein FRC20_000054 [Serendipita sp. 405]|nr:hypothetical protein FRC15_000038 [Serendipita sp. 397]KAG8804812.1 hypothetical protein FRC16_000066 [Serendipita sp. 398]KAG8879482.1 hypothetical protein FRC20_000054 [Serendipita sp. 405]